MALAGRGWARITPCRTGAGERINDQRRAANYLPVYLLLLGQSITLAVRMIPPGQWQDRRGTSSMAFGREHRAKARAMAQPRAGQARTRVPLRAHPAFAPLLGIWGAALGGVMMGVLPAAIFASLASTMPTELAPFPARLTFAAGAAVVLGLVSFALARALGARAASPVAGSPQPTRVRPLDPVEDLDGESLDAPLPASLFSRTTDWLPDQPADAVLAEEAAAELAAARADVLPGPVPAPEVIEAVSAAPRELDLAEFAVLPGRNAVWVEEPAAQTPAAEPATAIPAALAKLRAVPPAELSLCQMVERFAAALQDYQAGQPDLPAAALAPPPAAPTAATTVTQRELMLGEALEALARVSRAELARRRGTDTIGAVPWMQQNAG